MGFKDAGQAEVLRSAQKDDYVMTKLRLDVADLAQCALGGSKFTKWRQELDVLSNATYLVLTTLSGLQTLGEEYVNVVQVDGTKRRIPSFGRRVIMSSLQVGGPYAVSQILQWLELKLPSHPGFQSLRPEVSAVILNIIPKLRSLAAFIHRCNLSVFYLQGIFYHLAKRFTGVRYLLLRSWLGDESPRPYFRILGILTAIQLTVAFIQFLRSDLKREYFDSHETNKQKRILSTDNSYVCPSLRCSLCLEQRLHSTATPCGHLFCWKCIVEWVQTKPQCPLCREEFTASRLVCLQNYDDS